jgi:WD40 repeat protein
MTGHEDGVNSVAFSPDGGRVVSGGSDATVRIWDATTGKPVGQPLTGRDKTVSGLASSPGGQRIALWWMGQHVAVVGCGNWPAHRHPDGY